MKPSGELFLEQTQSRRLGVDVKKQNKAFTKHIVDALMQSYEEKLELEVSIMNAMLCVIWVLVFPRFQKLCVIC